MGAANKRSVQQELDDKSNGWKVISKEMSMSSKYSMKQIQSVDFNFYIFHTKTSKMEDAEKHSTMDLHMQFNSIQAVRTLLEDLNGK